MTKVDFRAEHGTVSGTEPVSLVRDHRSVSTMPRSGRSVHVRGIGATVSVNPAEVHQNLTGPQAAVSHSRRVGHRQHIHSRSEGAGAEANTARNVTGAGVIDAVRPQMSAGEAGADSGRAAVSMRVEEPTSASSGGDRGTATPREHPVEQDVDGITPDSSGAGGRGNRGGDRTAQDPYPEDPPPDGHQPGEGGKDPHAAAVVTTRSGSAELDESAQRIVDEAVDTILRRGDVFDQLRHFRRIRFIGGATSLASTVASVLYPMLIINLDAFTAVPGEVGITAGAAATAAVLYPAVRAREGRKARQILAEQEALSTVVGTPVELTRSKFGVRREKDVGLRWYGTGSETPPPAQVRGYLSRIASVAEQANLERLVLPYDQVAPYLPSEEEFGVRMTQTDFMQGEKNRALRDKIHGNDELLMVTPAELSRIITNIEVPKDGAALDTIMHTLRRVHPEHPAHSWYGILSQNAELARQKLRTIFQMQVDRDNEDMTRKIIDRIYVKRPPSEELPEGGMDVVKIYAPVYLTGTTTMTEGGEPSIRWQRSDGWHDQYFTALFSHLGFTLSEMQDMILNSDQYPPNRVERACEVAAWLTLQNIDIGLTDDVILGTDAARPGETGDISMQGTLQQRIYDREIGERRGLLRRRERNGISVTRTSVGRRTAHTVPALLLAGGVGVALGFGMNAIEHHVEVSADKAMQQIAVRDGYKSWLDDPHMNIDKVFADAGNNNLLYRFLVGPISDLYQSLYTVTNNVAVQGLVDSGLQYTPQDLRNLISQGTQPKDCSLCDAQTGNVADVPNQPVWYLKSFSGMSTDGYWAQTVYDTLGFTGMDWRNPSNIVGNGWEAAIAEARAIPSPDLPTMSGQRIRVQQEVNFSAYSDKYASPYVVADNNIVIPLPVLEGTHIIAASVENAGPMRLATFPDGTQGLVLPKNMGGVSKVEFWLAPGEGEQLKAHVPIQPDGYVKPRGIDALWAHRLGRPLPTDPEERLAAEIDLIRLFNYNLDPLKDQGVVNDRYQFAKAVLSGNEANCNVAAGILAISNPHLLNIVTGYLNQDSSTHGPQYLSGNEAHEWDIMPNGQYVDATPSTMTPAEARKVAEFLSENFGGKGLVDPAQQRQDQFLTLLEELGEMTIAAGVIWQRQRLLRGINRVGAWEANRRLENRPTESLQEVYDALNFALYSGKTERPSPAIRNEQDFLSAPPTRTELLALFARYARPDAYLEWLRGIKEKAGEMTDPEMSEQVREACAVIRNIHQFVSRTENAKKPTA